VRVLVSRKGRGRGGICAKVNKDSKGVAWACVGPVGGIVSGGVRLQDCLKRETRGKGFRWGKKEIVRDRKQVKEIATIIGRKETNW